MAADQGRKPALMRAGLVLLLLLLVGSLLMAYLQPFIGGNNMNLTATTGAGAMYAVSNGSVLLGYGGAWYDNYTVFKAGAALDQMGDTVLFIAKNTSNGQSAYLGYTPTAGVPALNQLSGFDTSGLASTPGVRDSHPSYPPWLNNSTRQKILSQPLVITSA